MKKTLLYSLFTLLCFSLSACDTICEKENVLIPVQPSQETSSAFRLSTTNAGDNWVINEIDAFGTDIALMCNFYQNTGEFLVITHSTEDKVYRTSNNGINFSLVYSNPGDLNDFGVVNPTAGTAFIVGRLHGNVFGALYTGSAGYNWSVTYTPGSNWSAICFSQDQNNGLIIPRVPGENVAVSTDGGSTWSAYSGISTDKRLYSACYVKNSGNSIAVVCGESGKIFRTVDNGANWNEISSPTTNMLLDIEFHADGTGIITGENGTVLRSSDGGINWLSLSSSTTKTLRNVNLQEYFWITGDNVILYSANNGLNWLPARDSANEFYIGISADGKYATVIGYRF